jgi:hypothetical protein
VAERMLIVKVKRTSATQAELYGKQHKFADLRLFDLADLAAVGLDPAGLVIGAETPARFWAYYELSDKLNQKGNPYKDVLSLEPVGSPATTTSTDNSAILAELRAMRALLAALLAAQGVTVPSPQEKELAGNGHQAGDLDAAFPRYGEGAALGDNPAEVDAYQAHVKAQGQPPASLDALRAWVRAQHKTNGQH